MNTDILDTVSGCIETSVTNLHTHLLLLQTLGLGGVKLQQDSGNLPLRKTLQKKIGLDGE